MTPMVFLIDNADDKDVTGSMIRQSVEETGHGLRAFSNPVPALAELAEADTTPFLVLIGRNLARRLTLARQLHTAAPLAHIVFLVEGPDPAFEEQLRSPFALIGNHWSLARVNTEHLTSELREAAKSARQRHQLRTTLNRINTRISSHPPADVSDLRRHAMSDRFLASVLEHARDAIIATNAVGTVITWNQAAEDLFGIASSDVLGRPLSAAAGGDWPRVLPPLIDELVVAGHDAQRRELCCRRIDGGTLEVEIAASLVRDLAGAPLGVSVIVRDIRERKQAEEALREANQQLEDRVAQRTSELTTANDNLELSNKELRRFAYIASHDLQSPLRSISGFLQLLQQDYGERLDERANHWIDRVVDNTNRMKTLIQDLLAYSRLESRARAFAVVDLNAILEQVLEVMQTSITEAHAQIIAGDLPKLHGDRSQLIQLLQNLIENAIKYNESAEPLVRVSARRQGGDWLFSIRDNGIGIDVAHREQVFEIFHRLHSQQAYPGTGIGLAVCRRIVQRHGGRIWAESRPDGSDFLFTLPQES